MPWDLQLKYSDILQGLNGLDDWLRSIGVPVRCTDRAHYSIQRLEKAQRAFLDKADQSPDVSKADYLFALTEALELHDVYRAFRHHPPDQLQGRLTRALSGPYLPEGETTKNRDGRNIMFELSLGAEWILSGADVALLEPDLVLKVPERHYLVACKRPQREGGIRAAIRDAAAQLRTALSSSPDNSFGIIALSLSNVLNCGDVYFSGGYDDLSEVLNRLMVAHKPTWRTADFHPRNIAVMFHAHTPADWGNGLYRLSAMRVGPTLSENETHGDLRRDLDLLYSRN